MILGVGESFGFVGEGFFLVYVVVFRVFVVDLVFVRIVYVECYSFFSYLFRIVVVVCRKDGYINVVVYIVNNILLD